MWSTEQTNQLGGRMGNQHQIEGKWDQATGKVKEEVGDPIDNEQMEYEGKADQAKGKVQEGMATCARRSTCTDDAKDAVDDRPRTGTASPALGPTEIREPGCEATRFFVLLRCAQRRPPNTAKRSRGRSAARSARRPRMSSRRR